MRADETGGARDADRHNFPGLGLFERSYTALGTVTQCRFASSPRISRRSGAARARRPGRGGRLRARRGGREVRGRRRDAARDRGRRLGAARRSPSCAATPTWSTPCPTTSPAPRSSPPTTPASRASGTSSERSGSACPRPGSWPRRPARPAARGAMVAVLDSGVAFERFRGYRRAPDLRALHVRPAYDFIDRDRHPNDVFGHGTHVTGTIAQATNNGIGAAGVAYGVKIMPLRVLDDVGEGDSVAIAKAIRYAARHGADVINLSARVRPRSVVAVRDPRDPRRDPLRPPPRRRDRGRGRQPAPARRVAYPARAGEVIAVGATTRNGCRSDYSNFGADLDVVAPGGGVDADPARPRGARPLPARGVRRLDLPADLPRERACAASACPRGYEGTSMASPHVAAHRRARDRHRQARRRTPARTRCRRTSRRPRATSAGRASTRATATGWSTRRARCAARR